MKSLVLSFLIIVLLASAGPSQIVNAPQPRRADTRQDPPPGWVGDHCSLFPDGDYADCCDAHDRDYYRGGTKEERKASDKRLRDCVRAKGHKYLSRLMYIGVRIGGMAWLPTPFRWGFGQKKNKNK